MQSTSQSRPSQLCRNYSFSAKLFRDLLAPVNLLYIFLISPISSPLPPSKLWPALPCHHASQTVGHYRRERQEGPGQDPSKHHAGERLVAAPAFLYLGAARFEFHRWITVPVLAAATGGSWHSPFECSLFHAKKMRNTHQ